MILQEAAMAKLFCSRVLVGRNFQLEYLFFTFPESNYALFSHQILFIIINFFLICLFMCIFVHLFVHFKMKINKLSVSFVVCVNNFQVAEQVASQAIEWMGGVGFTKDVLFYSTIVSLSSFNLANLVLLCVF